MRHSKLIVTVNGERCNVRVMAEQYRDGERAVNAVFWPAGQELSRSNGRFVGVSVWALESRRLPDRWAFYADGHKAEVRALVRAGALVPCEGVAVGHTSTGEHVRAYYLRSESRKGSGVNGGRVAVTVTEGEWQPVPVGLGVRRQMVFASCDGARVSMVWA